MPHKHTRKAEDKSTTDLPPSEIAKPLPVSKSANANGIFTTEINSKRGNNKKRKRNKDATDDTPKAFARLMAFQRGEKLPKGLDDGVRESKAQKKRRRKEEVLEDRVKGIDVGNVDEDNEVEINSLKKSAAKAIDPKHTQAPTIRPGEKMSDFSARVDAALPISGLINKSVRGGKDPLGLKVGRTKTEKKMHKMYAEWREEEARIQEKKMEAMELAEEEAMDEDGQVKWKVDIETAAAGSEGKKSSKGKGGKKKKKKVLGEVEDGDDDPWAKIKRDRAEAKIGLNDVVKAPPTFTKIPKEKFKVRAGAKVEVGNVPKASGSLRRREELGEVRQSVVDGYRQMMRERSGKKEHNVEV